MLVCLIRRNSVVLMVVEVLPANLGIMVKAVIQKIMKNAEADSRPAILSRNDQKKRIIANV